MDDALTDKICEALSNTDFVDEGHSKVWARPRLRSVRTSKARRRSAIDTTQDLARVMERL